MQIDNDELQLHQRAYTMLCDGHRTYLSIPEDKRTVRDLRALKSAYTVAMNLTGMPVEEIDVTHEGFIMSVGRKLVDAVLEAIKKLINMFEKVLINNLSKTARRLTAVRKSKSNYNTYKNLQGKEVIVKEFPIDIKFTALLKSNLDKIEMLDYVELANVIRNSYNPAAIDGLSKRLVIIMEKMNKIDSVPVGDLRKELLAERDNIVSELKHLFPVKSLSSQTVEGMVYHNTVTPIGYTTIKIKHTAEDLIDAPVVDIYPYRGVEILLRDKPKFSASNEDKLFNVLGDSLEEILAVLVERTILFIQPREIRKLAGPLGDKLYAIVKNEKIAEDVRILATELLTALGNYIKLNRAVIDIISSNIVEATDVYLEIVKTLDGD